MGSYNVTLSCTNSIGLLTSEMRYFYIDQGEVLISLQGTTYFSVEDNDSRFVVTSIPNDTLMGLVNADSAAHEIYSDSNGMSLRNSIGSITYLVYTQGTTDNIKDRTEQIKSGEFEKMPNPSFGFPISTKFKIYVGLEYDDIDIEGNELLRDGMYNLIFEKTGKNNNKNIVDITLK